MGKMTALLALSVFAAASAPTYAKEHDVDAVDFQYPELNVVPKASERLALEAEHEPSSSWTMHIPLQVSALTTLVAGCLQFGNADSARDPGKYSAIAGTAVGGAWLATTVALSAFYHPYTSGALQVGRMKRDTTRDQLIRERLAEEDLEAPASLAWKLSVLSVVTELGTSAFMVYMAPPTTASFAFDIGAAVVALTPILFGSHWTHVWHEQMSYKKRIYAPVASATLLPNLATQTVAPGLTLSWFL